MDAPTLHIAMYPWFAMGHQTAYLHLANKLAQRGHKISFLVPKRTKAKLDHSNHHPHRITFVPISVPHVDGLPHGAENTSELPLSLNSLLMTAMDRTQKEIELVLLQLKPNIVFFDCAYWLPNFTRSLGIKSVQYTITSLIFAAYVESTQVQSQGNSVVEVDLTHPSAGFPDLSVKLHVRETRNMASFMKMEFGSGVGFYARHNRGSTMADAIGFKGCREIEAPYLDYLQILFGKPVLLSGPLLPEPPTSTLEEKWASWLGGFKAGSVIYCALGSEWILEQNQFQELVIGLELTGFPFFAALKPPVGFESVEAALPEGFKERVQGRGVVHGGWVQQTLILEHPSIGCFITHCGSGSIVEALVNQGQLVLLPNILDQILNARMISSSFKAGVEVEKGEEDGLFTRESVCKAVKTVMDEESEVGKEVRANHIKLRNLLLRHDLESTYIDSFCHKLQEILRWFPSFSNDSQVGLHPY